MRRNKLNNNQSFDSILVSATATTAVVVGVVMLLYYRNNNYNNSNNNCSNNDDTCNIDDANYNNTISPNTNDRCSIIQDNQKQEEEEEEEEEEEKQQQQQEQQFQSELEHIAKQRQEERTGRIRAEVKLRQAMKELQQIKNKQRIIIQQQQQLGNETTIEEEDGKVSECDDGNDNNVDNNESFRNDCSNQQDKINDSTPDTTTNHISLSVPTTTYTPSSNTTSTTTTLLMESIGIVHSPFMKRMGTPRQPQLVPASCGYIQFSSNCQPASIDGIMEYSHLWIIFEFHANTDIDTTTNSKTSSTRRRCKIRPPRAPIKVGQLATRSPHRINPIGLSLVSLVSWDPSKKQLHISGLDLVNGTPVYDIKPCVPWDIPGYNNKFNTNNNNNNTLPKINSSTTNNAKILLKVPYWVEQDDEINSVQFTDTSLEQLRCAVINDKLLEPYYTATNDGYNTAKDAIQQILVQDPRSSHKGLKHNARGTVTKSTKSTTTNSSLSNSLKSSSSSSASMIQPKDNVPPLQLADTTPYNIIFGQLQISFIVHELVDVHSSSNTCRTDPNNTNHTDNNNDNDINNITSLPKIGIHVITVQHMKFDECTFVDGIPLYYSS